MLHGLISNNVTDLIWSGEELETLGHSININKNQPIVVDIITYILRWIRRQCVNIWIKNWCATARARSIWLDALCNNSSQNSPRRDKMSYFGVRLGHISHVTLKWMYDLRWWKRTMCNWCSLSAHDLETSLTIFFGFIKQELKLGTTYLWVVLVFCYWPTLLCIKHVCPSPCSLRLKMKRPPHLSIVYISSEYGCFLLFYQEDNKQQHEKHRTIMKHVYTELHARRIWALPERGKTLWAKVRLRNRNR